MVVKTPRSQVELSPGLRRIAELAVEKIEEPGRTRHQARDPWIYRTLILVGLMLVAFAIPLLIPSATTWLESRNSHGIKAEELRKQAHLLEDRSRELRELAASGKRGPVDSTGWSFSPRSALLRADRLQAQAATIRKQAYFEERLNQGYPFP